MSGTNGAHHPRGDRGVPAGDGGASVALVAEEELVARDLAWAADSARRRGVGPEVLVRVGRRVVERWASEALAELQERMR